MVSQKWEPPDNYDYNSVILWFSGIYEIPVSGIYLIFTWIWYLHLVFSIHLRIFKVLDETHLSEWRVWGEKEVVSSDGLEHLTYFY